MVIFVICDIIEGTHQQNSKTTPENPLKTVKERTCPMPKMIHTQLAVQIVETLKSICDHDINYISPSGKIYASTDSSRVGEFHEAGYRAAKSGEIMIIRQDNESQSVRRGINLPIRYHGDTVAVIGITGEPDEVSRYAYLAQRITLLLIREHEIDMKDRNDRAKIDYVVRALVQNEGINPEFQQDVLERHGIEAENKKWRCILFKLDRKYNLSNLSMIETKLQDVFERMSSPLYTYLYPDKYVLLAEDQTLEKHMYRIRELAADYGDIVKTGVGMRGSFSHLYQSCLSAGLAIQSLGPGENLSLFDTLDLEILLASASQNAKELFLKKCLKNLTEEDFQLLTVYFSCGQSLKATSKKLFMHINTLQYRLNRIHERCGYQPREFQDAVVLFAAVKLRKIMKG